MTAVAKSEPDLLEMSSTLLEIPAKTNPLLLFRFLVIVGTCHRIEHWNAQTELDPRMACRQQQVHSWDLLGAKTAMLEVLPNAESHQVGGVFRTETLFRHHAWQNRFAILQVWLTLIHRLWQRAQHNFGKPRFDVTHGPEE